MSDKSCNKLSLRTKYRNKQFRKSNGRKRARSAVHGNVSRLQTGICPGTKSRKDCDTPQGIEEIIEFMRKSKQKLMQQTCLFQRRNYELWKLVAINPHEKEQLRAQINRQTEVLVRDHILRAKHKDSLAGGHQLDRGIGETTSASNVAPRNNNIAADDYVGANALDESSTSLAHEAIDNQFGSGNEDDENMSPGRKGARSMYAKKVSPITTDKNKDCLTGEYQCLDRGVGETPSTTNVAPHNNNNAAHDNVGAKALASNKGVHPVDAVESTSAGRKTVRETSPEKKNSSMSTVAQTLLMLAVPKNVKQKRARAQDNVDNWSPSRKRVQSLPISLRKADRTSTQEVVDTSIDNTSGLKHNEYTDRKQERMMTNSVHESEVDLLYVDLRCHQKLSHTCRHVVQPVNSDFTRCIRASCVQPYAHMEPSVCVRKSLVHEYGLFARRDIKKNEIICMFSGKCINCLLHRSDYVLKLEWHNNGTGEKEIWYLDSLAKGNHAGRYINDSRNTKYTSNATYTNQPFAKHPWIPDTYFVYIRALCLIPKDSEIFADYGNSYWRRKDSNLPYFIDGISSPPSCMK